MMSNAKFNWFYPIAILVALVVSQVANTQEFRPGIHYLPIPITVERSETERVEVVELFSYGCIHCYEFEKPLKRWLNRNEDNVDFHRVHVVFSRDWIPLALAFYAAENLEVLDKIHDRLFAAIWEHSLKMYQKDLLSRLFEQGAGVDSAKFIEAFESQEVRQKVIDSDRLLQLWRVDSTPTLVVDGRFRIAKSDTVPTSEMMLIVAEHLVDQIIAERTSETPEG